MLERASVIGRSFSLDAVLQLIPPAEQEQAQARVFELVRRGLIRPDVSIPDDGFRFRHALIREAVYEAMPKALRADLHETVAAQLDDADAEPAVVGYHLEHTCLLRRELGLRDAELAKRAGRLLRLAAEETLEPHRRAGDDLAARAGARAPPRRRPRAARRAHRPRHARA